MGISNRSSESNKYILEHVVNEKLGQTFVYKKTKGDRNININQGNLGIGVMSRGSIVGNAKVAGIVNGANPNNVVGAAKDIQTLIQRLEQVYPTNTTTQKMVVATKAIEQIEDNPTLKQKAIEALTQGSLETIDNTAIGRFIVEAIRGW